MPPEVIVTLTKIHIQLQILEKDFFKVVQPRTESPQNIVDVYVCRQLSNYNKYLFFLIQKLTDDIKNSQMYLSQLRTLVDIFCSISYILSLETLDAARIIFCEDLIALKKLIPESFESNFLEYAQTQSNLFNNVKNFPQTHDAFSKSCLRKIFEKDKINLYFPETFENKLTKAIPFILKNTIYVNSNLNFNIEDSFLHTWNSFSFHIHGSHFFKDNFGKEHFWIASRSMLSSLAFVELLERFLFRKENSKALRLLLIDARSSLTLLVNSHDSI